MNDKIFEEDLSISYLRAVAAKAEVEVNVKRRDVHSQDVVTSKWQSQNLNPGYRAPQPLLFATILYSLLPITSLSTPTHSEDLLLQLQKWEPGEEKQIAWVFGRAQHFQHSGLSLTLGSQPLGVGGVIFSLSIKHNSGSAVSSSQSETKSLCWFEGKWNHCILLPFCH